MRVREHIFDSPINIPYLCHFQRFFMFSKLSVWLLCSFCRLVIGVLCSLARNLIPVTSSIALDVIQQRCSVLGTSNAEFTPIRSNSWRYLAKHKRSTSSRHCACCFSSYSTYCQSASHHPKVQYFFEIC